MAAWRSGVPLPDGVPPDLAMVIRPELDRIGADILGQLAVVPVDDPALAERVRTAVEAAGYSPETAAAASSVADR